MKKFKIPKNNWKSIPIDSAKFILDEGKDYLNYTIVESDKITKRAYSLVILLSTILSAIVGYTFSKISIDDYEDIIVMNLYFCFVLVVLIVYIVRLILPRSVMQKGRLPSKLAQTNLLLNPKLNQAQIYLSYIIREIENTQDKIDYNLCKNKARRDKLVIIIYIIIVLLPIYLLIAFCIAN